MNINKTKDQATVTNIVPGAMNKKETRSFVEEIQDQELLRVNGIQSLVEYYQNLFDQNEMNNYSSDDYQNAKRKFVKYLLNTRSII